MPTISVRELCAFGARRGDLDLRFTPAPTAEEGIAAHAAVAARRGTGYQREIRIEHRHGDLLVRGRADGLNASPMRLEEIKSHRGPLARMPENHRELHWAQLKLYGVQLCTDKQLEELPAALVYYDIDKQRETVLPRTFSRDELESFSATLCDDYLSWESDQQAHRERRDAVLAKMAFPHPQFHGGQRRFSEAIYRGIRDGRPLMAQAPTGIGKSIGSLFPALKAMSRQHTDKICYLTAKTSGRRSALDALASLSVDGEPIPLRVLELVARDKCCEHPGTACHGSACLLAQGFFDRLPAARAEAAQRYRLDQAGVRDVALQHRICPYYLAQEMVRWADVIVGDYNYYFDRSAIVYSLMLANDWRMAVLVDEGHNLVERARGMYSGEISQSAIAPLRKLAPAKIKRALGRLSTVWRQIAQTQPKDYWAYDEPYQALVDSLRGLIVQVSEHLADDPLAINAELQRFYFDALTFVELADEFGEHAIYDITRDSKRDMLTTAIRNVVPARYLQPRLRAAQGVALFSATLNPPQFYRDLLGFWADTSWLDVPSPFAREQLQVSTHRISTRLADRDASLPKIVRIIEQQYRQQPGNYLVFCSSYRYVRQLALQIEQQAPSLPMLIQSPELSEPQRNAFLERFRGESHVIGIAVLGGVFSEGVDLPGDRLIGAFIITLGLPEASAINERLRARLADNFGSAAYDYTYLYPGLQRVVQAAGRVIRSTDDYGSLHLIDDRFQRHAVKKLLPTSWF
jgi:DNA excision repair protein ERCC-2